MDFSSGESDMDSEEEVEKAKKAEKDAKKSGKGKKIVTYWRIYIVRLGPIQSSLIDSTDGDLVVPAIEDLDSMSLEQITELREKIRKKVEKAQEEEMVRDGQLLGLWDGT